MDTTNLANLTFSEVRNIFKTNNLKKIVATSQECITRLSTLKFVVWRYGIGIYPEKDIHFTSNCIGVVLENYIYRPYINTTFEEGIKYICISYNNRGDDLKPLIAALPKSVIHLELIGPQPQPDSYLRVKLDITFPPTLKYLLLHNFDDSILHNLPEGLEVLHTHDITGDYSNLPIGLKELLINNDEMDYDEETTNDGSKPKQLQIEILPPGLTKLIIYYYDKEFTNLPPGLETLIVFNYNYKGTLNNLPASLKHLIMRYAQLESITNYPPMLKSLELSFGNSSGKMPIDLKKLPPTVKCVKLNNSDMEYNLDAGIPANIKDIYISTRNKNFQIEKLPDTLERVHLITRILSKLITRILSKYSSGLRLDELESPYYEYIASLKYKNIEILIENEGKLAELY
jgi:hypothetical protein